jgi:hypothetical protein
MTMISGLSIVILDRPRDRRADPAEQTLQLPDGVDGAAQGLAGFTDQPHARRHLLPGCRRTDRSFLLLFFKKRSAFLFFLTCKQEVLFCKKEPKNFHPFTPLP